MVEILSAIPSRRRDEIFSEIRRVVTEVDAVDRSLDGLGEGIAVDEALEQVCELVIAELQAARKTCTARPRTKKKELACPA